jgi:hypothetical protein
MLTIAFSTPTKVMEFHNTPCSCEFVETVLMTHPKLFDGLTTSPKGKTTEGERSWGAFPNS